MSEVGSPKVRSVLIAVAVILALVSPVVYYAGMGLFRNPTSEGSRTSVDTTFTTDFYYRISVNYSGSWSLAYWGENGTVAQNSSRTIPIPMSIPWKYNLEGNLTGSGDYETTVVTYGVGYVENMLCARATKLNSQGPALILTVVNRSNSTTASDPSAEVCVTYGV